MVKRNRSRERARAAETDTVPRPPATVTRIHTALEAEALAHWLLQPGRPWPVVVVSTAAESTEPYVDADRLKSDVGDLAEVAVVPTGDVSWSFSSTMPPMTQVYGGASRVYSVDHDWVEDPHRSPLRFAYSTADDERVRARLAHDALASAVRAGVVAAGPVPGAVEASGVVRGVVGPRAFVTLDDGTEATVWEELTAEGIPLDHVLAAGMRLTGEYDPGTRRLDLRHALAESATTDLAAIGAPDDLVLAEVVAVTGAGITLRPAPGLPIVVSRELITGNPADDPADLFTVGEVVVARVCDDGTALRLDDIGDIDEPTNPAPSLLAGGPPWLTLTPARAAAPAESPAAVPAPAEARPAPADVRPGAADVRPGPVPGPRVRPAAQGAAAPTAPAASPAAEPEAVPRRIPTPGELVGAVPAPQTTEPMTEAAPPGPAVRPGPGAAPVAASVTAVATETAPRPADAATPASVAASAEAGTDGDPRRPTPRDLATRGPGAPALPSPPRPATTDGEVQPTSARAESQRGALREVTLLLAAERARVTSLGRELTVLKAMDRARAVELTELRRRAADLESELGRAMHRIEEQKTRYRRADRARQLAQKEIRSLRSSEGTRAAEHYGEAAFLDPAEQFRHEVYLEWTRRVPAAEKPAKPLAEYSLGDAFLPSLDSIEGVNRTKLLRVAVEVLTGDARHIPGRDVHRLRWGAGGDDPYVTREDGAQAWRAALQRNTPGARRLHYWQLPGGTFELSRVVLHDDMEP